MKIIFSLFSIGYIVLYTCLFLCLRKVHQSSASTLVLGNLPSSQAFHISTTWIIGYSSFITSLSISIPQGSPETPPLRRISPSLNQGEGLSKVAVGILSHRSHHVVDWVGIWPTYNLWDNCDYDIKKIQGKICNIPECDTLGNYCIMVQNYDVLG